MCEATQQEPGGPRDTALQQCPPFQESDICSCPGRSQGHSHSHRRGPRWQPFTALDPNLDLSLQACKDRFSATKPMGLY